MTIKQARGTTTHNGTRYTWLVYPGDFDVEVDVTISGRARHVVQSYTDGVLHDVFGTLPDDAATAIAADIRAEIERAA